MVCQREPLPRRRGGDFRNGFFSAAFASIAGAQVGNFRPSDVSFQLIGRSIVGGTASVVGGGKFANGAYSAAFSYAVRKSGTVVADEMSRLSQNHSAQSNPMVADRARIITFPFVKIVNLGSYTLGYNPGGLISKEIANEYANSIMNVWRKNTGGAFITVDIKVISNENADILLSHVSECANCGARDAPGYAALGGREIWYNGISSGVTPGHEFGHILGLNHQPYENKGIMSNYFSNLRVVNERDVDMIINLYGGGR